MPQNTIRISKYDEVLDRINQVRYLFSTLKIKLHKDSVLNKCFNEAEKFVKQWNIVPRDQNSRHQLKNLGYVHRITDAILLVSKDKIAIESLHRIATKGFNLADREKSQGKDALWELELLSRLRFQNTKAELGEPDIIADFGMGKYGIACKKIYSVKGIKEQVRRGAKQVVRSNLPGIVALNIDDLLPIEDLRDYRDEVELREVAESFVRNFVQCHTQNMRTPVDNGKCDAVTVSVAIPCNVINSQSGFICLHHVAICNFSQTNPDAINRINHMARSFKLS